MTTTDLLAVLLRSPTPESLRALQTELLAVEQDARRSADARRALDLAGELHDLLAEVSSKLGARAYSQLASWLDIGAVGAAALEGLSDPGKVSVRQIGLAALSETLMVAASRQYVKAWSRELDPVAARTAWRLREALWVLSLDGQPALGPSDRAEAIDAVLTPALADSTPIETRFALFGRVYQLLILTYVARALGVAPIRADQ